MLAQRAVIATNRFGPRKRLRWYVPTFPTLLPLPQRKSGLCKCVNIASVLVYLSPRQVFKSAEPCTFAGLLVHKRSQGWLSRHLMLKQLGGC